jgi:CDP-diacylglycerol--serine O-phosphatidyltransferase
VTLASVFCGFNAMRILATPGAGPADFYRAAVLLVFAMLFDLLDGRVARMTKTQSAFGLQLDSLADIVSFGAAPALLVYQWVLHRHPGAGLMTSFLFIACGAIRLARFNVLSSSESGAPVKPGRYIVGLPIPPASGVIISLVMADHAMGGELGTERYTLLVFGVTILVSLLMVSTVRFRSFKDFRPGLPSVALVLFVLLSSALVWNWLSPQFVLLWLLALYVGIGLVEGLSSLARRALAPPRDSAPPAAPVG